MPITVCVKIVYDQSLHDLDNDDPVYKSGLTL
jgi:hypothetical protein